jgi:hypothetical protein
MVSLKQFVLSQAYHDFKEYLEEQIKLLHTSLEMARSVEDVHRLQGQIYSLRRLQSMREELLKKDK